MRKWFVGVVGVALAAMSGQGVALADSSAAELPPTWHIHDCVELTCTGQHKPVSFFPTILDVSQAVYLQDRGALPERGRQGVSPERTEEQERSAARRNLPNEHDGHPPAKRSSGYLRTRGLAVAHHATEPGFITYYQVTQR